MISTGATDWRATLCNVKSSAAGQLYVVMISVTRGLADTRVTSVRTTTAWRTLLHQNLIFLELGRSQNRRQLGNHVLLHLCPLSLHLAERGLGARGFVLLTLRLHLRVLRFEHRAHLRFLGSSEIQQRGETIQPLLGTLAMAATITARSTAGRIGSLGKCDADAKKRDCEKTGFHVHSVLSAVRRRLSRRAVRL